MKELHEKFSQECLAGISEEIGRKKNTFGIPEKVSTSTRFERISKYVFERVPAKTLCGIYGRKEESP